MKCIYCGREANNATTRKGLYVCCCYMLHKVNGDYVQHKRDGGCEYASKEKAGS